MDDQQVGVRIAEAHEGHQHQDQADAQHHRQRVDVQLRAQQDAHRQRPEHVGGVHRVLHGRAETDNTQRADHAHAQRDIALDAHDHRRGDQRQHHQRHREGGAVQHAAVAPLVNEGDDQAHQAAHRQADRDLQGSQVLKLAEEIIADG